MTILTQSHACFATVRFGWFVKMPSNQTRHHVRFSVPLIEHESTPSMEIFLLLELKRQLFITTPAEQIVSRSVVGKLELVSHLVVVVSFFRNNHTSVDIFEKTMRALIFSTFSDSFSTKTFVLHLHRLVNSPSL